MMKYFLILLSFSITFISTGLKADWEYSSNGLQSGNVISFTVKGNIIFAGVEGSGIFTSTNNGQSWNQSLQYGNIYSLTANSSAVFAANCIGYLPNISGEIKRSLNDGISWTTTNFTDLWVRAIAANGNTIFAGTTTGTGGGYLYISTNNGTNWNPVSIGSGVFSLAIEGNTIYAGTYNQGVYRSTNNGLNWNQTSLNNQYVVSLSCSGNNVYAGTYYDGIYCSTNNGSSWFHPSLNTGKVYCIISNVNCVMMGTVYGVYVSYDLGLNWTLRNEGMGNYDIYSLFICNNYIFGGRGGVYRRLLSEMVGVEPVTNEVSSHYSLFQNYPNPFNPITKIDFSLPKECNVRLEIYDLSGAFIETLFNGYLKAGSYKTEFDGADLSSGVYFYRLTTEKYTETKKMLLIK